MKAQEQKEYLAKIDRFIESGRAKKVIHIAENSIGYEVVTLVGNRINRRNSFSLIKDAKGAVSFTGGFILKNSKLWRKILDKVPAKDQYKFVRHLREEPFSCLYFDEVEI